MAQCYNMGSDGHDAAWKCEASMPDGYRFSSVEVRCCDVLYARLLLCGRLPEVSHSDLNLLFM